jgi:Na+/melibiose symporter-like transporter
VDNEKLIEAESTKVSEENSKPATVNDPLNKQLSEKEKKNVVICGILTLTVISTLYLNVGAFFPLYVDQQFKGKINSTMVAIILCAFEVSAVLCTPIHAITISKMGRKNAMLVGMITIIISTYMLGFLAYFPKDQWLSFYLLAIVARLI